MYPKQLPQEFSKELPEEFPWKLADKSARFVQSYIEKKDAKEKEGNNKVIVEGIPMSSTAGILKENSERNPNAFARFIPIEFAEGIVNGIPQK